MAPGFGAFAARQDMGASSVGDLKGLRRFLEGVKGWEPSWMLMAGGFHAVRVQARRTVANGEESQEQRVIWKKLEGTERGKEWTLLGDVREWLIVPPVRWWRHGNGEWHMVSPVRLGVLPGTEEAAEYRMTRFWQAWPVEMVKAPWGITVRFVRLGGQGNMEWEVSNGTGLVERMRAWDSQGDLEWEEQRRFRVEGNRVLLIERNRLWRGTWREAEVCEWDVRPDAVTPSEMEPPTP